MASKFQTISISEPLIIKIKLTPIQNNNKIYSFQGLIIKITPIQNYKTYL